MRELKIIKITEDDREYYIVAFDRRTVDSEVAHFIGFDDGKSYRACAKKVSKARCIDGYNIGFEDREEAEKCLTWANSCRVLKGMGIR